MKHKFEFYVPATTLLKYVTPPELLHKRTTKKPIVLFSGDALIFIQFQHISILVKLIK